MAAAHRINRVLRHVDVRDKKAVVIWKGARINAVNSLAECIEVSAVMLADFCSIFHLDYRATTRRQILSVLYAFLPAYSSNSPA